MRCFRRHVVGSESTMAETINPEKARELVASNELFVLDVRDEEEWLNTSDRIPASTNVPAPELEDRLDELPDDQRILVVSPDGSRSAEAAEALEQGGREAIVLEGGVEAWSKEGHLTQPSPDPAEPT